MVELLVVISIIGVLASIVIAATSSARNKAKDSRVSSDVKEMRNYLELKRVGDVYDSVMVIHAGPLSVNGDGLKYSSDPAENQLYTDVANQTSSIFVITNNIGSSVTSYAIYGKLVSDPTKYYCMDSMGKTLPSDPSPLTSTCQ